MWNSVPSKYRLTLDIPLSCRGFKNYKKVIIKKLYTQNKKSRILNKFTRDKQSAERNVTKLQRRIAYSQNQILNIDQNIEKEKNKSERLKKDGVYIVNHYLNILMIKNIIINYNIVLKDHCV